MSVQPFTLEELAELVTNARESREAKRLALSVAYHMGARDALAKAILRAPLRAEAFSPVDVDPPL